MAAFFSEELVNEVVSANDIVDIVSGYVRLKRSGSGYMGCCPFHREKTPSFHVSADKQLYHCFGCGAGGSVIQFVMNSEGLDFPDALRYLAERAGIRLPEDDGLAQNEEKYKRKKEIYAMNRDAALFFRECLLSESGKGAQQYLTGRALSGKAVASFGIGFSPGGWDNLLKHLSKKGYSRSLMVEAGLCIQNEKGHVYDRFRERVMFPIIDVKGNVIGFGGRILKGDGAKYMNSPESIVYDKGKNLFALNIAKKSTRGYYILVEGYMDVISLHQAGIDAAVAGCGTALTREQARLIAKSPVYLCYDSDEAGQKACDRAANIFKEFDTKLKVISIPDGKDADDFVKKHGKEGFEALIKNAKTVAEYKMDGLLSGVDLNDASQKIELLNNAARFFSGITNAVEREVYVNRLSLKTGISQEAINSEIRKANAKNIRREVQSELRQTVSQRNEINQKKTGRRQAAEANLLSLLTDDQAVYNKFRESISAEFFGDTVHKKIFESISKFYEEKAAGKCADFLLGEMQGYEKELATVLLSAENIADNLRAAQDFIQVIENEIFDEKLQKAQEYGDIEAISELLKTKKQKKGGY